MIETGRLEIVSNNFDKVGRLIKQVRIQAKCNRSLQVLRRLKKGGMRIKLGVIRGVGEIEREVIETMYDWRSMGVDALTLGEYLQTTYKHRPVSSFIAPEKFAECKEIGLERGFRYVESGPLVYSSYRAEKHLF